MKLVKIGKQELELKLTKGIRTNLIAKGYLKEIKGNPVGQPVLDKYDDIYVFLADYIYELSGRKADKKELENNIEPNVIEIINDVFYESLPYSETVKAQMAEKIDELMSSELEKQIEDKKSI